MKKIVLRVKAKNRGLPRSLRLEWLQQQIIRAMHSRITSVEGYHDYIGKRSAFRTANPRLSEKQQCFICVNLATIRHHIVPLILGGRNKSSNIVPLCLECHTAVHKVGPREQPMPIVRDDDPGVLRIKDLLHAMYDRESRCIGRRVQ